MGDKDGGGAVRRQRSGQRRFVTMTTTTTRTTASSSSTRRSTMLQKVITKSSKATSVQNGHVNTVPSSEFARVVNRFFDWLLLESKVRRFLCVELPLALLLATVLTLHLVRTQVLMNHAVPYMEAIRWTSDRFRTERTYPSVACNLDDITVVRNQTGDDDVDSLQIPYNATVERGAHHMMWHGVGALEQAIYKRDHAEALRTYILRRNEELSQEEELPVIEFQNRWHFSLHPSEDPSVIEALHDLYQHEQLRSLLSALLDDDDPAVVELSAITAGPGAKAQVWHSDTEPTGSAACFADSFSPMYSLLVPLQDTSADMGATSVCPGSHLCSYMICDNVGFQYQPTSKQTNGRSSNTSSLWPAGQGLLYNSQARHRGSAHLGNSTDEASDTLRQQQQDHRVVTIISFAKRPTSSDGRKINGWDLRYHGLPRGSTFSTRWDSWGMSWRDLLQDNVMPTGWKSLLGFGRDGWTIWKSWAIRITNSENRFTREDLIAYKLMKRGLWGRFIPKFLHGPIADTTFIDYMLETLARVEYFLALIYVTGMVWFLLFVLQQRQPEVRSKSNSSTTTNDEKHSGSGVHVLSMTFILTSVVFLCVGILWVTLLVVIGPTLQELGEVREDQLVRKSQEYQNQDQQSDQPFMVPLYKDVLLSSRPKGLGMQALLLDYNGGNRIWLEACRRYSDMFVQMQLQLLSSSASNQNAVIRQLQQQLVDWITIETLEVSNIESEADESCAADRSRSLLGGSHRLQRSWKKFLVEDLDSGDWRVATEAEVIQAIRKELWTQWLFRDERDDGVMALAWKTRLNPVLRCLKFRSSCSMCQFLPSLLHFLEPRTNSAVHKTAKLPRQFQPISMSQSVESFLVSTSITSPHRLSCEADGSHAGRGRRVGDIVETYHVSRLGNGKRQGIFRARIKNIREEPQTNIKEQRKTPFNLTNSVEEMNGMTKSTDDLEYLGFGPKDEELKYLGFGPESAKGN